MYRYEHIYILDNFVSVFLFTDTVSHLYNRITITTKKFIECVIRTLGNIQPTIPITTSKSEFMERNEEDKSEFGN